MSPKERASKTYLKSFFKSLTLTREFYPGTFGSLLLKLLTKQNVPWSG